MEIASIECHARESSGERSRHRNTLPLPFARELIVCSRRSDSRALEKNSGRKKKGRLEGERGRELLSLSSPLPRRFPGVQFNSLPTDRRALLSERLEQASEPTPSPSLF